jgi:hypothetical protein
MARRIEHRTAIDQDPKAVYTALVSPEYLRARLDRLGGKGAELVEHHVVGDEVRYLLRHGVAAENIPGAVRALVGGDITIDRKETWRPHEDAYLGAVQVTIPGMPGEMSGQQRLSALGSGSELVVLGSVSVPIPLFGGKIEETVAEQIRSLLDAEAGFTATWLREHQG